MRKFLITVLVLFLVNFILAYFFMLGFNIVGRDSYGAIASGITGSVFGGMLVILWPYLIFYKLFTWKKFVVIYEWLGDDTLCNESYFSTYKIFILSRV